MTQPESPTPGLRFGSSSPVESGRIRHGSLIHQPLTNCYEPVTDRIPQGMKAGSPHGPGARDPGEATVVGSLHGLVYPVVYDRFVDHGGHLEVSLTHSRRFAGRS